MWSVNLEVTGCKRNSESCNIDLWWSSAHLYLKGGKHIKPYQEKLLKQYDESASPFQISWSTIIENMNGCTVPGEHENTQTEQVSLSTKKGLGRDSKCMRFVHISNCSLTWITYFQIGKEKLCYDSPIKNCCKAQKNTSTRCSNSFIVWKIVSCLEVKKVNISWEGYCRELAHEIPTHTMFLLKSGIKVLISPHLL